jgi:hypothetical protein
MWKAEGGNQSFTWERLSVEAKRHWRRRARMAMLLFARRAVESRVFRSVFSVVIARLNRGSP